MEEVYNANEHEFVPKADLLLLIRTLKHTERSQIRDAYYRGANDDVTLIDNEYYYQTYHNDPLHPSNR